MARVTKAKLKAVVKECLIEILAEGIAPGNSSAGLNQLKEDRSNARPSRKKNER